MAYDFFGSDSLSSQPDLIADDALPFVRLLADPAFKSEMLTGAIPLTQVQLDYMLAHSNAYWTTLKFYVWFVFHFNRGQAA